MASAVLSKKQRDNLLVFGYIRLEIGINIPEEIIKVCLKWYHSWYEILKWSKKLKNGKEMELSDDNKCLSKNQNSPFLSIVCDTKPVYKGIHCWRIKQINKGRAWVTFGVSEKRKFNEGVAQNTVWGIAYNQCWYAEGHKHSYSLHKKYHNQAQLSHFNQSNEIDIYLDCDKGEMKLCVVGECVDEKEAQFFNMPINAKHGWVPHINSNHSGFSLRIAKIFPKMYGKKCENMFV